MKKFFVDHATNLIFYLSFAATIGSLFFGGQYTPCELCWYQRILMYPIAVLTGASIVFGEKEKTLKYIWFFAIPGYFIALYHYLLQMKVIGSIFNCGGDIACSSVDWHLGQFINFLFLDKVTIPFLSLFAFTIILAILGLHFYFKRKAK